MDADDHPVEEVLKESRCFMVPLYQRKYQWADKQLTAFWDDVSAKAAEVLEGSSKFEHYMGALILAPIHHGSQIAVTPTVQVVDGQQRLTTFQLFLTALREVARTHERVDLIAQIEEYLFNKTKSKDKEKYVRFKLNPTPTDRGVYFDILEKERTEVMAKYSSMLWGGRVPKNTDFPAFRAYDEFYRWVDEFVSSGPGLNHDDESSVDDEIEFLEDDNEQSPDPDVVDERIEAILTALLERLKLVVITLGESDDAQVIFETLNSKGEPLLAMDLVRNNIFYRAEKENVEVESLYSEFWDQLDESWWRENAPNARPRRPRIDHFLAHVLTAETGASISVRELYAEYREFAVPKGKPRFPQVVDELKLLDRYVPIYRTLEGKGNADETTAWLGRKLRTWLVTTVYPVALQIGTSDLNISEKEQLARLIYSFVVRRAICGLTAKNLNKVFQLLAAEFKSKGVSFRTFDNYFSGITGASTRFPDDEEFLTGIREGNAYSITPQPRLVDTLWELECHTRTKMSETTIQPEGLWVEHVMPRQWQDQWPFADGVERSQYDSEDTTVTSRNSLIHTLGNLTLVTSSLNQSVGNTGFTEKKEKFDAHTGLFLNKWFSGKECWYESDIQERSQLLGQYALLIWPGLKTSQFSL